MPEKDYDSNIQEVIIGNGGIGPAKVVYLSASGTSRKVYYVPACQDTEKVRLKNVVWWTE